MLGASRNDANTRHRVAETNSMVIKTESNSADEFEMLWRANCHARPHTQNTTASMA